MTMVQYDFTVTVFSYNFFNTIFVYKLMPSKGNPEK